MAQFGYPTSDITRGSWTDSTGTTHYGVLDEVSYSDSDYIQANNLTANACEVRVNTLTDPQSSNNHVVHLRVQKAGSGSISLTVALVQNTTVIRSQSITLTTSWADQSFTLTAGEADSITDYTNLRIRFTATCASSTRYVRVSWANVEVPNVNYLLQTTAGSFSWTGNDEILRAFRQVRTTVGQFVLGKTLTGVVESGGNETQDFSEYGAVDDAGGHLSITSGAALAGTGYGMRIVVDDTTYGSVYGTLSASGDFRARFYFDPNSVQFASVNRDYGNAHLFKLQMQGGGWYQFAVISLFHFWSSGTYTIRTTTYDDSGVEKNIVTDTTVSDAPHYLEMWVHRATNSTSNDGFLRFWVDGVEGEAQTGLDNYNNMLDYNPRYIYGTGYKDLATGSAGGILYVDELIINNDGSEIGAYGTGTSEILAKGSVVRVTPGSFIWTRNDAQLIYVPVAQGYYLFTTPGSFAWTRNDAIARVTRQLRIDAGSFIWTRNNAILDWHVLTNYYLWTTAGSFAWTRNNAALLRNYKTFTTAGSFAWTRNNAIELYNRQLRNTAGSFSWTRNNAYLLRKYIVFGNAGSFTWTRNNAIELYKRLVKTTTGQFVWTGLDAILTRLVVGQYYLFTQPGTFSIAGTEKLLAARQLHNTVGSFSISSSGERLLYGRKVLVTPGGFVWVGNPAILTWVQALKLLAQTGQFNLTLMDAILNVGSAVTIYGLVTSRDRNYQTAEISDYLGMTATGSDYGE